MVANAVKAATENITADFTAKLDAKDTVINALRDDVNKQTSTGKRAEIVSFVEAIPAEKGKHFLKNAGVVNFLESLAVADEADKEPAINFSEGEGDKKVEHKFSRLDWAKNLLTALPAMISFGEKFGSLDASGVGSEMIAPDREKELTEKMGVSEGGAK